MKIAFITLGCKLNFAETATYERGFRAAGLEVVPWREKADIYLINTCTVTETSNKKSRGEIRKVHRINPEARIIVTGCYAQMKPDEVRVIPGVSRVFSATEKALIVPETLAAAGLLPAVELRSHSSLRPLPSAMGPSPCPCPGVDTSPAGSPLPPSKASAVIPEGAKEPVF